MFAGGLPNEFLNIRLPLAFTMLLMRLDLVSLQESVPNGVEYVIALIHRDPAADRPLLNELL